MTLLGQSVQRDWEASFTAWLKPPGQTEQERCDRALTAIRKAIASSQVLTQRGVDVIVQGSYRNRTNVRQDSDVDVCVRCRNIFFPEYPAGITDAHLGNHDPGYSYAQFRNDVGAALVAYFGAAHVKRGKKAFDIHENTYRVDSDVVAAFGFRQYYRDPWNQIRFNEGVGFYPDPPGTPRVTNFPDHQFENNKAKNERTSRRFRALTRIVKTLRNEMAEQHVAAADPIASYLVECLVWNWPDPRFDAASWRAMVINFLTEARLATNSDQGCSHWMEENNIKRLFGPHNGWTRQQVNAFCTAALHYIAA